MEKKPKVLMICGVSASGKSRLAKLLELRGVPRLSIDNELWPDFYVYSDLLSTEQKDYLYSEAMKRIIARMGNFCAEGRPCSVDMPFCHEEARTAFRAQIEKAGGEAVLLWLKAPLAVLKERLAGRAGKNGPDNLPVTEEEIERYFRGFRPVTEFPCTEIDSTKEFDTDKILDMLK